MHKNILKKVWCVLLALSFFISPFIFQPQEAYGASDVQIGTYNVLVSDKNNQPYVYLDRQVNNTFSAEITNSQLDEIHYDFDIPTKINRGDKITCTLSGTYSTYNSCSCRDLVVSFDDTSSSFASYECDFNYSKGKYTFTFVSPCDSNGATISLITYNYKFDSSYSLTRVYPSLKSITCSIESESTGLMNSILEWLQAIKDSITGIPDKIQSFFNNLIDNIKAMFENVGNWFKELGNSIKEWFTQLGDNISGFFEKLWNRIWWGNENGESEYQPPVFSSGILDVLEKLDDYYEQLEATKLQIDKSKVEISDYVSSGTEIINGVFGVFPSMITAFVVFGIVFVFSRKVVGR